MLCDNIYEFNIDAASLPTKHLNNAVKCWTRFFEIYCEGPREILKQSRTNDPDSFCLASTTG